jgi:hypothetical protein
MAIYGISTFCDDIRFEQQNKISLIGCYGAEIIIYHAPPVALPKLGIAISIRMPLDVATDRTLMIFRPHETEPFYTFKLPEDPSPPSAPNLEDEPDLVLGKGMLLPLLFSPIGFERSGNLRVRLKVGEELYKIGAIRITFQPPANEKVASG